MIDAVREVVSTRSALGYTIAAGCVFGTLLGYLTSVQQILQQQYELGARFPLYFGVLAVSVGGASDPQRVTRHAVRDATAVDLVDLDRRVHVPLSSWASRTC